MLDKVDPRATNVMNCREDQQQIEAVIDKLEKSKQINAYFVLSNYLDCPAIKDEPRYAQILFASHLGVVIQLFEWMLMPRVIAKRLKLKKGFESYPYQCREFLSLNEPVYEQLYISLRNKKINFSQFLSFLHEQHYDKECISTSLGYFLDVIVPFARNDYSKSFVVREAFQNDEQIDSYSIMKIVDEKTLDQLVEHSHHQQIHGFFMTAILSSIQDASQHEYCKVALAKFLGKIKNESLVNRSQQQNADELAKFYSYLQNLVVTLKQIIESFSKIDPEDQKFAFSTATLIQSLVQEKIVKSMVDWIIQRRQFVTAEKTRQKLFMSTTQRASNESEANKQLFNSLSLQKVAKDLLDFEQDDVVELMLKILTDLVQVYIRMPRNFCYHEDTYNSEDITKKLKHRPTIDEHIDSLFLSTEDFEQDINLNNRQSSRILKDFSFKQYSIMTNQYREQMDYLLNKMDQLQKLVYVEGESSNPRVMPFPTGQNVRVISLMKYQYFELVHKCLLMAQIKNMQAKPETPTQSILTPTFKKSKSIAIKRLEFKLEKLHLIEIVKKYLAQNRWNNTMHHLLEKIWHLLVICNYELIQNNIEKYSSKKKFSDSFVAFLIESFTNKDFIFLTTVNFTSQGNLHSIYNIAKDLAFTLNKSNQLVVFLSELEPWDNFILNQLKQYEERTYPVSIQPDQSKIQEKTHGLKIDEASLNSETSEIKSIKQLVGQIQMNIWSTKKSKKSHIKTKKSSIDLRRSTESFKTKKQSQFKTGRLLQQRRSIDDQSVDLQKPITIDDLQQVLISKMMMSKKVSEIYQFTVSEIRIKDESAKFQSSSDILPHSNSNTDDEHKGVLRIHSNQKCLGRKSQGQQ